MKLINYSIIVFLVLAFSACEDHFDVNTDPTRVSEDDVTLKVLLPTVIEGTSDAHYLTGSSTSQVAHYTDNIVNGYYQMFSMSGAWSTIYLKSLNNLATIIEKAEAEGSPHYAGVAKILQAVNVAMLADCWENAPYSEALKGSENISPSYDNQEKLYMEVMALLDAGLKDLGQEESFSSPSADDLIYNGDLEKWIKATHSLKARYLLHLSKKSDNTAAILSEIDLGFSSNADDFQLTYTSTIANPWFSAVSKKILENIFTITYGAHFMNTLNGEFFGVIDPRLPIIAETDSVDTYIGLASYDDDAPTYTVLPSVETYYMMVESPLLMMTYSELKLIEAEIKMQSNPGEAHAAYVAGIKANMDKLGVAGADQDAYLASPEVDLGGTADLEHIMKEKYISLALNPEIWNDMRRYNFSPDVFRGFIEPEIDGELSPNAQRAVLPSSEQSRNLTNYDANYEEMDVPMWKDQ